MKKDELLFTPLPIEKGLLLSDFDGEEINPKDIIKVEDPNERLFEDIQRYGTFICGFECTGYKGTEFRVRVAKYEEEKYFVVQANGNLQSVIKL